MNGEVTANATIGTDGVRLGLMAFVPSAGLAATSVGDAGSGRDLEHLAVVERQ